MVKCGIIGCGVIAPTHIEGFQQLDNAEVVHLCDLIPERMNTLGDKYGIARRSQDYHDLLADPEVDLVSVCTDHASHAGIVRDVLNAGKHVICEKSAARVIDDIPVMLNAVKAHPELVSSGIFQHRFETHNQVLRDMLNSGTFGKLLAANLNFCCRRTAEYYIKDAWRGTLAGEGGGILINQAIHHLDQLRFLFGDIAAITAKVANLTHQGVIEVEDTAVISAKTQNGGFSFFATNTCHRNMPVEITIYADGNTVKLLPDMAIINGEVTRFKKTIALGKACYGSSHAIVIRKFYECVEKGEHFPIDGKAGATVVRSILNCYKK